MNSKPFCCLLRPLPEEYFVENPVKPEPKFVVIIRYFHFGKGRKGDLPNIQNKITLDAK